MKYVPPVGGAVNDPYVDANPGSGIEGSPVPAAAIEHPMREILAVISAAGLAPSEADLTQLKKALDTVYAPVSSVSFFAMGVAPTGWLKANGATISRTVYASLFAAIGTTFGAGDGVTTFKIPDLRGEFPRGWDDGRGIDTSRTLGSSQLDSFQGHWHNSYYSVGQAVGTGGSTYAEHVTSGNNAGPIADIVRASISDGANGTPRISTETRPRNIALLACIRY